MLNNSSSILNSLNEREAMTLKSVSPKQSKLAAIQEEIKNDFEENYLTKKEEADQEDLEGLVFTFNENDEGSDPEMSYLLPGEDQEELVTVSKKSKAVETPSFNNDTDNLDSILEEPVKTIQLESEENDFEFKYEEDKARTNQSSAVIKENHDNIKKPTFMVKEEKEKPNIMKIENKEVVNDRPQSPEPRFVGFDKFGERKDDQAPDNNNFLFKWATKKEDNNPVKSILKPAKKESVEEDNEPLNILRQNLPNEPFKTEGDDQLFKKKENTMCISKFIVQFHKCLIIVGRR